MLGKKLLQNNKILVLPFGGGEDIESFLNIDYFDNSNRPLFLIIDSDKQENNEEKQNERALNFKNTKQNGKSYVIYKSCIENYYHPRTFERVYNLEENIFEFFNANDNVRKIIKRIVEEKQLGKKNIKEKNNFKIFNEMNKVEFEEIVEQELIEFLREITD